MTWRDWLVHIAATVGAGVIGIATAWVLVNWLDGRGNVGPQKKAKSILSCDGCSTLVMPGGFFHIDAAGYLLCAECAKDGDVERTVGV